MPAPNARFGHDRKTRNSTPSPLLLSPRDMELAIVKERMRCDRHAQYFALIAIQINKTAEFSFKKQVRLLARLLHRRLRLTDEKGMLLKGGLGVLLPMTELHGATVVLNWILKAADEHGLSIEADVFTYSGKDDFVAGTGTERGGSNSESDFQVETNELADEADVDSNSSRSTVHAATIKSAKIVRADSQSQIRTSHLNRITATSTVSTEHLCPSYPTWKRATDIGCALIGLTFAVPIITLAGIAIKMTSRGPVFFRQMRTGQFGNAFPIYKLRTMVVDAEELKDKLQELNERDGPAFKMSNDPRVTSVGKLLRKTGLDELPQLWNVLVGHMAIVGPRPLPCNEDAKCMVWQRRRLDTKPGLTCIWQISKSRKVSFEDWMRMDLRYTDRRSVRGDISLVFKTVMAVFLGRVGH